MPEEIFYAHSFEDRPESEWQRLEEHLQGVSALAGAFAENFGAAPHAQLAGLWHDLGKYQPAFQARLKGSNQHVDHSIVGALQAKTFSSNQNAWLPLSLAIAGHHGGLPDILNLRDRIKKKASALDSIKSMIPNSILADSIPPLPPRFTSNNNRTRIELQKSRLDIEFWTRFLYSALVDADFLDTEMFLDPRKSNLRQPGNKDIAELRTQLEKHLNTLTENAPDTTVNLIRQEVLNFCKSAAEQSPGFFSLSAPTAAGKTLSSMMFALRHAEKHGLRRIIVVIPYTSIIEQNAKVYRGVFGAENIIEHHSALDIAHENGTAGEKWNSAQLACENWDAPIIVTTNVQFFESLFSNRPSRCRKLHNIARSVVIFDEVQALPPQFLISILDSLGQLVQHFGTSIVLSTATQPAFSHRESFTPGLKGVREIIPDSPNMAQRMNRVGVTWPNPKDPPVEWPKLAEELSSHKQVLAIVHRRADARELARLLPSEGRYHLSALMCPRHRSAVLSRVYDALAEDRPCRLVSTQLIEAGVDIDFPVVYRAFGGLDSIAQAAGRCNREGKQDTGRLVVFRSPSKPPCGTPRKALESTESLYAKHGFGLSIIDPELYEAFFRNLYFKENLDGAGIQPLRANLRFAEVGKRFKLIEDGYSCPVIVPYPGIEPHLQTLYSEGPSRELQRALQPFYVNIYHQDIDHLLSVGALEVIADKYYVLTPLFRHLYSEEFGLIADEAPQANPDSTVI